MAVNSDMNLRELGKRTVENRWQQLQLAYSQLVALAFRNEHLFFFHIAKWF